METQSTTLGVEPEHQQWGPISGALRPLVAVERIPVARLADGPGGVDWTIEATWDIVDGRRVPAFLMRPCVRFAFVSAQAALAYNRRQADGLARILLRPGQPGVRDPRPLDWAEADIVAGRQRTAVNPDNAPSKSATARRNAILLEPWAVLQEPLRSSLGWPELAGMDAVDAAVIALLAIRGANPGAGRHVGHALPGPEADLVDVLVDAGLSVVDASARVARVPSVDGAERRAVASLLEPSRQAGVRARQRGPKAVRVPDPSPARTSALVRWLRQPRTARLLRVVSGLCPVESLEVGIADPPTIAGWMASSTLPFHRVVVPLPAAVDPPRWLPPEDIDRETGCMSIRGFAATEANLVARTIR